MKTPQAGQLLDGRYRILRPLAEGGFGQTYIAEDIRLPGQPLCVVKYLKPAVGNSALLNNARRLFNTEAEILQMLGKHEHIPQLLAFFEEDGDFFLVQEFIEGHTLTKELLPGRQWSGAAVCQLLWEVLTVLEFVHAHGVIHRDIKPDNLIRRRSDNTLLVVDFGTVKQVRNPTKPDMQISATIAVGTPGYMPTEQSHGKPRPNSDIYALGIIGIQALTGVLPSELPEDTKTGELVWYTQLKVDKRLINILKQMVRYHFKDRYQSASEVLNDLAPLVRRYEALSQPQSKAGMSVLSQWWVNISSKLATQELPNSSRSKLGQTAPTAVSYAPKQPSIDPSLPEAQPTVLSVNRFTDVTTSTTVEADIPQRTVLSDVPSEPLISHEKSPQMTILSAVPVETLTSDEPSLQTDFVPLSDPSESTAELSSDLQQIAPQQTVISVPDALTDLTSTTPCLTTESAYVSLDSTKTQLSLAVSPQQEDTLNTVSTPLAHHDETTIAAPPTQLDLTPISQPLTGHWRSQTKWLLGIGGVGAIAATAGALFFFKQHQDYAKAQNELAKIEAFASAKDYEPCAQQAKTFESKAADLNDRARSLWGQCLGSQAATLVNENRFLDALTLIVEVPADTEASVQAKALKETILDAATQRYRQGKFAEATAIATALIDDATVGAAAKQQLETWQKEQDNNEIALAAANQALAAGRWDEAIKNATSLKILGQPISKDSNYWKSTIEPIVLKAQQALDTAKRQAQSRNRVINQPSNSPTRPAAGSRRQPQQPRQNRPRPSQPSGGSWNVKPL